MKNRRCINSVKFEARRVSIIDIFQHIFGEILGQYITLCNEQDKSQNSEYSQIVLSGLVPPQRFYGIDFELDTIRRNKHNFPQANWRCGNMYTVIKKLISKNKLNPSIIYFDSISMKKLAVTYAVDLMRLLSVNGYGNFLLVVNIMANNPRGRAYDSEKDILAQFQKDPRFNDEWWDSGRWSLPRKENGKPYVVRYKTSGTEMLSVPLVRR